MRAPDIQHVKKSSGRCDFCGEHGAACTGEEFPEHARLRSIKEYSEKIGAFLEWLDDQGVVLATYHQHTEACEEEGERVCGISEGYLMERRHSRIEDTLAQYFEIDLKKIETEKRRMLAQIRIAGARRKIEDELGVKA